MLHTWHSQPVVTGDADVDNADVSVVGSIANLAYALPWASTRSA